MVPECGVKPFCIGIDGVSVTVKCKTGGAVFVATPSNADGYIFGLEECEEAIVVIEINLGINVFGFSVDGNKNITPVKNYSKIGRVYRKKVPIHISIHKDKEPYTQYNENHIKLLEIGTGTGGYFAVWEAAIVFQRGNGFLTIQRVYEEFAYWDGNKNKVSCPKFVERWPQLVRFVENICEGLCFSWKDYPCLNEYAPDLEISMDDADDGVGMIKWFNVAQGFGAISTNKGDAFVHYKDIDSPERLICLEAGDMVLFEKLIPNTSNKGGGGFPYKAIGVLAPEA